MPLAAREQPQAVLRNEFEPALDRRFRARGNRHQPFLAALAAKDHERLPLAQRAAAESHQLARSKARTVEQFEQREIADRRRLTTRGAILGRFEHRRDLALVENAR